MAELQPDCNINGKTPDEIKKGLAEKIPIHYHLPNPEPRLNPLELMELQHLHGSALAYIQQLESTVGQVSKALCDKENATTDELLQAASQLKSRLAQVERERDAAVAVMAEAAKDGGVCIGCKHSTGLDDACEAADFDCNECKVPCMCRTCEANSNYEWLGVCEENSR